MTLAATVSRYVFHPLWDIKDRSKRLKTLRDLLATQWLPRGELEKIQSRRLAETLQFARTNSPYYRRLFEQARFDPQSFTIADFRRLPLMTKQILRSSADEMLCTGLDKSRLTQHRTGGSTGISVSVYLDENWLQVRGAAAMRSDQWAGHFHGMKTAAVWGNPPVATTFKQKVRNLLYDRYFYLDTMNINPASLQEFVARWRRERPDTLFGHSHSLFIVAQYLEQQKITDLKAKAIIATSMMLIPSERAVIERAFSCPATNRYGCEEVGLIACECEQHNGLHLDNEQLYVELLRDDGEPAAPGEEGKIVITDLVNRSMPIIRYRIEDVGVLAADPCVCGRGSPLLKKLVGRTADYLRRADGSKVAGVSLVERTLTAISGIEQMQIVQPALDKLILNIVPAADYTADTELALRQEFAGVFGNAVELELRKLDRIAQERNGKYRFSICQVSDTP